MEMNKNEIIKALEWCAKTAEEAQSCEGCPLLDFSPDYNECQTELMKQSLDLINRKNAEIEELKRRNQNLTSENENLTSALKSAKTEVERLTGSRDTDPMDFCGVLCKYAEGLIAEAKSEAYNEFAERLKGLLSLNVRVSNEDYSEIADDIDDLLTELTERKEDEGK